MSYLKHRLAATFPVLLPAAAFAAVIDLSPPLQNITVSTTPVPPTTVIYSVFDPALGNTVQDSDNVGPTLQTPRDANGVVAWSSGSQVSCRVYEPLAQSWNKTNLASAATIDLTTAHGVVAWSVPGTVYMAAWDRARRQWVASATGVAGSASSLQTEHGHVTWSVGSRVYYRAYDPVAGQWTGDGVLLSSSVFDLTTRSGVITWSVNVGLGMSDIYMATYDPTRAAWGLASQRSANTFDLKTDNAVVAWSANASGVIYYFAYDPVRGAWAGNATASGSTQNLLIQTGTVYWSANSVNYVRGYNAVNGLWTNSFTVPYAAFGVTPRQGNAQLVTTFFDLSLGASSWNWNFGDGGVEGRRSPTHVYSNFASNHVTLSVIGPGGGPAGASSSVLSDITPPTGTVLINMGAETTTNTLVDLTLSATDNSGVVTGMRFSNDGATWSTWQAYATQATWTLDPPDGNKTVHAQFRDGTGNTSAPASDGIKLDTTPVPNVSFELGTYTVGESAGSLSVKIRLSNAFGSDVSIDYATADGSAVAGEDYGHTAGHLVFVPTQTEHTIVIPILPDQVVEPNQTFTISLSHPTNAIPGGAATVTILDDDPPRIAFTAAEYSVDEDAGTAMVSVGLNAASGQTVSIRYATTNGTAQAGSDYEPATGQIIFAPNQTVQAIPIPIIDNDTDEPLETVELILFAPVNGVLTSPSNAVLRILDDDPPTARFSARGLNVAENSGSLGLSVRLSKPFGETVSVDVVTSNETAEAGLDYNPFFTSLIFFPGQTNKPVTLTLVNDSVMENGETFAIYLQAPFNAVLDATPKASVFIRDDDAPRFVSQTINAQGRFEATITGPIGEIFLMQASTNEGAWYPLELLTNQSGSVLFVDPATPSIPARHYRVQVFDP